MTGRRRRTILIVEDDEYLRRLLSLALRTAGFDTREAHDGVSAITLLESAHVDAVLLDIVLPGIDGLAVHDEIMANASTRDLPVIVVTGSDLPLTHLRSKCILRKPVDPDEVVATVERCLRQS